MNFKVRLFKKCFVFPSWKSCQYYSKCNSCLAKPSNTVYQFYLSCVKIRIFRTERKFPRHFRCTFRTVVPDTTPSISGRLVGHAETLKRLIVLGERFANHWHLRLLVNIIVEVAWEVVVVGRDSDFGHEFFAVSSSKCSGPEFVVKRHLYVKFNNYIWILSFRA